ncbi:uncharacterized protein C8A04DRAFT_39325 [Dichotomopilus funicola]|uniref:Uncharacterized protein n=1 Tax=Dichotomopilus funicola TaxID=1934379 RepID=A0AAN6UY02_9PEZI|nr:hypothetical protein C8A04DRAFT_39325 [Dichotomopilus funicola]
MTTANCSQLLPSISTIENVINAITSSRERGIASSLRFHWEVSKVEELSEKLNIRLVQLDQPKVRRFEYDYESETVYLDIMGESPLHYQSQAGLSRCLQSCLAYSRFAPMEFEVVQLIDSVVDRGTTNVKFGCKLWKQPDVAFGRVDSDSLPPLVCEEKAHDYINLSDNNIQAVLILDLEYPDATKAWVSLLVSNGSRLNHFVHGHVLFYDDELDQQPAGRVVLYLSDFVGLAGLPAAYCRPSAAELDAGIMRNPTIILTFDRLRAIFRWARHIHDSSRFTIEAGDKPQDPYVEARLNRLERLEMERKLKESERQRIESERQRIELERRVTEAE